MIAQDLIRRHIAFAVRIVKLVDSMPNSVAGLAIARQIVRSGTSPSANYRAACIGKSKRDFINKMKIVEEELDETLHWLEIIELCDMLPASRLSDIKQECKELLSITVCSIKTAKNNQQGIEV